MEMTVRNISVRKPEGSKFMDQSAGIILEGGAMRSVFSAGILDRFMEEGIRFPNVLAISASAYAGMNYLSGQKGRMVTALIEPLREYKYMGLGTFLKKGTFFDMDYLFKDVPRLKSPFDFEAMKKNTSRFITSTVNCLTGELVYHEKFDSQEKLFEICQAANSMPLIAKVTTVDGIPMLDGGVSDAIPIAKAVEEGWKKIVVIFTRDASYRKKPYSIFYRLATRLVYHKYPNFRKLIKGRADRYNNALDKVAELEKEGRAFVFRPTAFSIKNGESNVELLMKYYRHGYDMAGERMEELKRFLEI